MKARRPKRLIRLGRDDLAQLQRLVIDCCAAVARSLYIRSDGVASGIVNPGGWTSDEGGFGVGRRAWRALQE